MGDEEEPGGGEIKRFNGVGGKRPLTPTLSPADGGEGEEKAVAEHPDAAKQLRLGFRDSRRD
jgi:hypothetical protein